LASFSRQSIAGGSVHLHSAARPVHHAAWAGAELVERPTSSRARSPPPVSARARWLGAALTRLQTRLYWRDTVTLFGRCGGSTKDNCTRAHHSGETAWFKQGNLAEAGARYNEALRIRREYGTRKRRLALDTASSAPAANATTPVPASPSRAVLPTSGDVRCNLGVALNGTRLTREAHRAIPGGPLILIRKMPDALNNLRGFWRPTRTPGIQRRGRAVRLANKPAN